MSKKRPSTYCPAAKHPKHSNLSIANIREKKPGNFIVATNVDTRKRVAFSDYFAKVSVFVYL